MSTLQKLGCFAMAALSCAAFGLLLATFMVGNCHAAENWVDVSVTSLHLGAGSYNKDNFGLGFERKWGETFIAAGRYRNSLDTPSRYAVLGWTPAHWLGADIGGVIGALDGYAPMRGGKPFLAVAGVARWSGPRYRLQLMLLPPIKGSTHYDADGGRWDRKPTPAALGLMFGGRFK